MFIDYDSCEAY
jgi:hypothetical protein